MSDDEGENYEKFGIPTPAGELKLGGHVIIKSRPCKIVELTWAKPGKHGSAKAIYTGIDIFTEKKYSGMCSTGHNVYVPEIVRKDYQVTLVNCEDNVELTGEIEVLDDKGVTLNFPLPDLCENDKELSKSIINEFNNPSNKLLFVSVVKCMGKEHIKAYKLNDPK